MKNKITIIITILLSSISYAQTPTTIVDIDDGMEFPAGIEGKYYKDIQGFMDPFAGTWLYTNGNTSFKMVLTKNTMYYTGKYWVDEIVGQYEYIVNNVTIRSTLNNTNPADEGIWSGKSLVRSYSKPPCSNCPTNERRLEANISDLDRDMHGILVLKLITVNGQPAIEAYIFGNTQSTKYNGMELPSGYITLIRQ